jgi:phage gp29-like protein
MKETTMALLDAYGKEIPRGRPVFEELGVAGVRDMYSTYPSQGLTPERLAAILKEADRGDIMRQVELFEEMEEKDAHLGSVLQTRKLAVTGLEWEVSEASGESGDVRTAEFVKEALLRVENLDEALADMLDAVGKGFSVLETMWEVAEGRFWIKELKWRHQKKFTFLERKSDAPMPSWPRLLTDAEPVYGEELPGGKFVVHRQRSRSGLVQRAGLLRPCAWMYLFKNYTLKDWVVFGERYAMPMRVGKFGPGASEADRKVLRNAVFNLGADAAAVISDSTVVELLESAGKGATAEIYEKLAEFCDRSVSKAVLGQTLTTEQSGGAYATARVHQMVRQDLLEADARALARTVTMQVVRPLVEFNFGQARRLPHFRFHHEATENLRETAETLKTLSEMGVEIPAPYVHERFGIPIKDGRSSPATKIAPSERKK